MFCMCVSVPTTRLVSCNLTSSRLSRIDTRGRNNGNPRQKRPVSLWKRQEIQEVSRDGNARFGLGSTEKADFFRLSSLRSQRSFTVGSGSHEEGCSPIACKHSSARDHLLFGVSVPSQRGLFRCHSRVSGET